MKKKDFKFFKKLIDTPSPSGMESDIAKVIKDYLTPYADYFATDSMGNLRAYLMSDENLPTCLMDVHIDEIGFMVKHIDSNGYIHVYSVGGVDPAYMPGVRLNLYASNGETLRGVVVRPSLKFLKPDDRTKVCAVEDAVIDLGLPANEVKDKVSVGDYLTFSDTMEHLGKDMVVSRALDDKSGVYIACKVMKKLAKSDKPHMNFVVSFSVQEEIGCRGASVSAYTVNPDFAIVYDVSHTTDYPGVDAAKWGDFRCGLGPTISTGPNISPAIRDMLLKSAEELGVAYQLEPRAGVCPNDTSNIQITREGIPCGLISVPIRYMHSPHEICSTKDIASTVKIIAKTLQAVEE